MLFENHTFCQTVVFLFAMFACCPSLLNDQFTPYPIVILINKMPTYFFHTLCANVTHYKYSSLFKVMMPNYTLDNTQNKISCD